MRRTSRAENYRNGDAIPSGLGYFEWNNTTLGATSIYGQGDLNCESWSADVNDCDESWAFDQYGRLYNWYAVNDLRGLCPNGWYVPSDNDWMILEMALGMSEEDANSTGYRGSDQGGQLKATYGWYNDGNGDNASGFSGNPGGIRTTSLSTFQGAGNTGFWWTSSPLGGVLSSAYYRRLSHLYEGVNRNYSPSAAGYSIRCIKDPE